MEHKNHKTNFWTSIATVLAAACVVLAFGAPSQAALQGEKNSIEAVNLSSHLVPAEIPGADVPASDGPTDLAYTFGQCLTFVKNHLGYKSGIPSDTQMAGFWWCRNGFSVLI